MTGTDILNRSGPFSAASVKLILTVNVLSLLDIPYKRHLIDLDARSAVVLHSDIAVQFAG